MALVVLLRGVNVGGHRTFKPSLLLADLRHLEPVNIGAAGTFVIRKPISQTRLRAEFKSRLPFETQIIICHRRDIDRLLARPASAAAKVEAEFVHFVSVLASAPRVRASLPMAFPPKGQWQLKILSRDGRIVTGVYRRQMEAIRHLAQVDKVFGVPATTRNWNTVKAIAKVWRTS